MWLATCAGVGWFGGQDLIWFVATTLAPVLICLCYLLRYLKCLVVFMVRLYSLFRCIFNWQLLLRYTYKSWKFWPSGSRITYLCKRLSCLGWRCCCPIKCEIRQRRSRTSRQATNIDLRSNYELWICNVNLWLNIGQFQHLEIFPLKCKLYLWAIF